ncbi:hypothetical protein N7527_000127 [Penicillium freii]|nr:hypothetical protein N7527_000127 [Penicillium freii]
MFGGPPSKGKKITCPTRGQASPALRPQKTCAPERFAGFAYCSVPEAAITGCLRQRFLAHGQVISSEH